MTTGFHTRVWLSLYNLPLVPIPFHYLTLAIHIFKTLLPLMFFSRCRMILGNVVSSFWVCVCEKKNLSKRQYNKCWLKKKKVTHEPTILTHIIFTFKCSLPNLVPMHMLLHGHTQCLFLSMLYFKRKYITFFFFSCSLRHLLFSEISPTSLALNITMARKSSYISVSGQPVLFIHLSIHLFTACTVLGTGNTNVKKWPCLSGSL